jgi:hypothetical protein
MAEPESAVLPITPYPTDPLKRLVAGLRRPSPGRAAAAAGRPRADEQTTKDLVRAPARLPRRELVARRAQAVQGAVPAQQFQRLEQWRADQCAGGGDPDRAERLARFEREIVQ